MYVCTCDCKYHFPKTNIILCPREQTYYYKLYLVTRAICDASNVMNSRMHPTTLIQN